MNDNGYDIRDYYQVNAQFGDKDDLRTLIDEAHARGLKMMLDIVINHTSTEHEWFQQAQQSVDNPYRDYYFSDVQKTGRRRIGYRSLVGMHGNTMSKRMLIICIYLMLRKRI